MLSKITLYYNKTSSSYKLGDYRTLKDFIKATIPKDMDYSEIGISFSYVNRNLTSNKNLNFQLLDLKDYIDSSELDDIFDWSNFVVEKQEKEGNTHIKDATEEYLYLYRKWDRADFIYRYVGRYEKIQDFGIEYFEKNRKGLDNYNYLIPYITEESLSKKVREFYNLENFSIPSLSEYRQSLRLPPTQKYHNYLKTYGFIGDYQDWEDFEYKNDKKKEEQFQKYIKDNQYKIDLLNSFNPGKKYLNDNYDGDIDKLLEDPNCPWELEDLVDWDKYSDLLLNSRKFLYEEDVYSETAIFVFKR